MTSSFFFLLFASAPEQLAYNRLGAADLLHNIVSAAGTDVPANYLQFLRKNEPGRIASAT